MMKIDFFMFCGVISINLALFYGQGTDLKNILGLLIFKYFWGVPDILDIFGDKE